MNNGIFGNAKPSTSTATLSLSGLTITKTGNWFSAFPPPVIVLTTPQPVQFGSTYLRYNGKWTTGFFTLNHHGLLGQTE